MVKGFAVLLLLAVGFGHPSAVVTECRDVASCIEKESLKARFEGSALSRGLRSSSGNLCSGDPLRVLSTSNCSCTSCVGVYRVCEQMTLSLLNVVENNASNDTTGCRGEEKPTHKEAYGYGMLISVAISLTSLLSVFIVPFLKEGTTLGKFYKSIYAFMMGSSSSALFCDAVLIILPEIIKNTTAAQSEEAESAAHLHQLWIGSAICAGMYVFFLYEFLYYSIYRKISPKKEPITEEQLIEPYHGRSIQRDLIQILTSQVQKHRGEEQFVLEHQKPISPTYHYSKKGMECKETTPLLSSKKPQPRRRDISCHGFVQFLKSIKPLAWLIILGDGIHNVTDGVALGAAMSSSLSLGLSTGIALVMSEIPHELGDFVVLLSTGLSWPVALLLNFLHACTALVGLVIGVALGNSSDTAIVWVLGATVSVFIYIALVDLIPPLLETTETGWKLFAYFLTASLGFLFSFGIVLVIAVNKEKLNCLIS